MEKYTIKNIITSQISDIIVRIILFSLFLILVWFLLKDYDTFIIHTFFLILYITYDFYVILKSIRISLYFKKNNISFNQKILWYNTKNCFLLQDRILICKFRVIDFLYSEIKSIQVIQKKQARSRSSPYIYYLVNIELSNGKEYKIFMYENEENESYEEIDNITDILLEKNANIKVKEMKKFNPFE